MKYLFTKHRFPKHLMVLPFIYAAGIFLILLDLWAEVYHRIAFPIYRIPYVRRGDYIIIDRHKLRYLNLMQKINCAYCGYANGVIRYITKIIVETEIYWCGIQHKKSDGFLPPPHHKNFVEYNNESAYYSDYESKKVAQF